MKDAFAALAFPCGRTMPNRYALAPLTNCQSHVDGTLSDEEFHWLTLRAQGGFGLTMTCAAHVQAAGQGFPGQLGIFGDQHLPGLTRLAGAIRQAGSLALAQLHHAGMRSPRELIGGAPLCPSEDAETGARALSLDEISQLAEDFINAAVRARRAGFDGVELHGAHGYILAQFLSSEYNHRDDRYGGSLENRARLLLDIVRAVRERCGKHFIVGVRLSPERFGQKLAEMQQVARWLVETGVIDFLDLSLWDYAKMPEEEAFAQRSLLSYFTELPRGNVKLGVAGKIYTPADVARCLDAGADFVLLGRAAILQHDFPHRAKADPDFTPVQAPVSAAYLHSEGVSQTFVDYLDRFPGFVAK